MRANRVLRIFVVPILLVGACMTSGCAELNARFQSTSGSSASTLPPIDRGAENAVVNSVNGLRSQHHMTALAVSSALVQKARFWARWMAAGDCGGTSVCHSVLSGGIGVQWSWLAENVGAASPRTNAARVISGFRNSPEHAANILSPRAQYVGVGVAYAGNTVYVVEEFLAS